MQTAISDAKLRAWWFHRQGLDGSLAGQSASEVLARTGWARSVGGAAPYLALFARAGLGRADVDSALEKVEIHELPSARGCTYVIPAPDFPLALAAGQPFSEDELKVARRLGFTDKEIDKLRAAVVKGWRRVRSIPMRSGKRSAMPRVTLGRRELRKALRQRCPWRSGCCRRRVRSGGCR